MTADITHIGDLQPDRRNARKHNPRNIGMIVNALHEVGAARSIVIDEDNNVLAGNGTIEAAGQAGITQLRVIDATGDEIIAVRRSGLSAKEKKRLALYDNRTAELAEWEPEVLGEDKDMLEGLFSTQELDELLKDITEELEEDPGAQIDRAAELQEKWQTQRGQLWQVGRHRLLCGDATSAEDVAQLMGGAFANALITDPPYGVDKAAWDSDVFPMLESAATVWAPVLGEAGVCFWFCATRYIPQTINATSVIPYRWMFIWYPSNNMAHGDLGFQKFTAALVLAHGKAWRKNMQDLREVPITITGRDPGHPTPKPLELIKYLVEMSVDKGQVVADGFLGSGTTMVAAEQTGRTCYGMEIEPKYVAVALERLSGMSITPERIDG